MPFSWGNLNCLAIKICHFFSRDFFIFSIVRFWGGEFGRTPKINKNASRDHWPQCYSVLLAGGGVKKGFVYGKSDKHASEPEEDPVTPEDLTATIYYLLGIDPRLHIYDTQDRPLMISSGEPVMDLIA
ncbi:MAG: DUF1501 domain-containing protein [Verrucomicrobiales bacterium]|nr:DUF1501 domain-containing protein [Verrucomicrobiales bacterium]